MIQEALCGILQDSTAAFAELLTLQMIFLKMALALLFFDSVFPDM